MAALPSLQRTHHADSDLMPEPSSFFIKRRGGLMEKKMKRTVTGMSLSSHHRESALALKT